MYDAASTSYDRASFEERLAALNVPVRYRRNRQGGIVGVAFRGLDGITYSGRKLAPDLSWPNIEARWLDAPAAYAAATTGPPSRGMGRSEGDREHRQRVLADAAVDIAVVARAVRERSEPIELIARSTGDLIRVVAERTEPRTKPGAWRAAAGEFAKAARPVGGARRRAAEPGAAAALLRQTAWRVAGAGLISHTDRGHLALALALAELIGEIGAWQRARGLGHQAAACTAAGSRVTQVKRSVFDTSGQRLGTSPGRKQQTQQAPGEKGRKTVTRKPIVADSPADRATQSQGNRHTPRR